MSSKKPFFSVVIPTRNRANLLPLAIGSVLQQTFGDFEIIISDNFSSDETPQVVQNFDDERIKYYRAEKSLSIGESFEFALSHAKGEYVTFLSDDDAHAKVFLERFYDVISQEKPDIISCNLTPYYAVDTFIYGRKIKAQTFIILPFTREISILNRKEAVSALFSSIRLTDEGEKWKYVRFPQLVNAAYHNSIIEKVKQRVPKIFPVLGSDIYSCALFLNAANKFCYVDEPLCLYCIWEGGETTSNKFSLRKYPEECIFEFVPLKKTITSPNYITNLILRAKSDWGEDYLPVDFDWSYYFVARYQEINYMRGQGANVSEELQEFENALMKQNQGIREKLSALKHISPVRNILRVNLKQTQLGKILLRLKYRHVKTFDSSIEGFKNIKECAARIDENFLSKYLIKYAKFKADNKWI